MCLACEIGAAGTKLEWSSKKSLNEMLKQKVHTTIFMAVIAGSLPLWHD